MEPNDRLNRSLKKNALVLGWMLVVAGGIWGLAMIWPVLAWLLNTLAPFLIALVVAYIFHPIVIFVQHKLKLGRIGGILVVAALLVIAVLGFFGMLAPILYTQIADVVQAIQENLPKMMGALAGKFEDGSGQKLLDWITERLQQANTDISAVLKQIAEKVPAATGGGASAVKQAALGVGNFLSGILGFVVALIMVLVISFYLLLEFGAIPRILRLLIPHRYEKRSMEVLDRVDEALGGFLRGQLMVCGLVAILATIGLAAIGMWKYALLVGILSGLFNIVPYLGPITGMVPGVIWALLAPSHETWGERAIYVALVLGLFALIQTLDGLVFQPRIVGRHSNLHPLVVLAALLIGAQFGLVGMILAVPTACIVRVLFLELFWRQHVAKRRKETPAEA
ncbi:AI-2E family transporter [bacterium]|nr:AI-2E family transporter [bacterium]